MYIVINSPRVDKSAVLLVLRKLRILYGPLHYTVFRNFYMKSTLTRLSQIKNNNNTKKQ